MEGKKKVHITNSNGVLLYTNLYFEEDSRSLRFASGGGFVDMTDVEWNGWLIVDGWKKTKATLARETARTIYDLADDAGIIQAADTVALYGPTKPTLHTAQSMWQAADYFGCMDELKALVD